MRRYYLYMNASHGSSNSSCCFMSIRKYITFWLHIVCRTVSKLNTCIYIFCPLFIVRQYSRTHHYNLKTNCNYNTKSTTSFDASMRLDEIFLQASAISMLFNV